MARMQHSALIPVYHRISGMHHAKTIHGVVVNLIDYELKLFKVRAWWLDNYLRINPKSRLGFSKLMQVPHKSGHCISELI